MKNFMEPFRIKSVEPLTFLDRPSRQRALRESGFNLFKLTADEITIDMLTDSGTGAMSAEQWAALHRGDETYAGARSFARFEEAVQSLTGFSNILPTHQGRAAERILYSALIAPGRISVANTHFDTTRANVEILGGEARDLPCAASINLRSDDPFKGDIDLPRLEALLSGADGGRVAIVVLTITNNAGGGQPVSPETVAATRALCTRFGVPLFLDGTRFAENAYLITQRHPAYAGRSPRSVAEEIFRQADGCWISLKKDGLGNIGGVLAIRDDELAARCRNLLIATEGFSTYGGLAGRDLEVLAQGLTEILDPDYLRYRADSAAWFATSLREVGVPVFWPPGCHAAYVDGHALLPHLPRTWFPAHALACELYLEGAIRGCEIGTLMLGQPGSDGAPDTPARYELLRLAIPRRVYTRSHLEYVVDAAAAVVARQDRIPGYRVVSQPAVLRHFTARLEPVPPREFARADDAIRDRLNTRFDLIDRNGNGVLDAADFAMLAERIIDGLNEPKDSAKAVALRIAYSGLWGRLRDMMDTDHDGVISREEYTTCLLQVVYQHPSGFDDLIRPTTEAVVTICDTNDDGVIDLGEFVRMELACGVGRAEALRNFQHLDRDHSGYLSVDELTEAVIEFYTSPDDNSPGAYLFGARTSVDEKVPAPGG